MRRRAILAAAFLLPAIPALAQQQGTSGGPLRALGDLLAPTNVGADAFVQVAAISDNFEIESSRLLLARSQHPQIRDYAERMIEHHTQLSTEMRSLPEATTRMPAALDERHSRKLATLRAQEEVDLLNRTYVQQQIEGHEEALAAYEAYANNGDVPVLRAFAQRHVGTIRQHLEMAKALQAPQGG